MAALSRGRRTAHACANAAAAAAFAAPLVASLSGCATPSWTLEAPRDIQRLPTDGGEVTRVSATTILVNHGPGPISILAFEPTVSTTINTSRGLPPITVAEGEELTIFLTGAIHDSSRAVRRCTIVTSAGDGTVAFEVTPAPPQ